MDSDIMEVNLNNDPKIVLSSIFFNDGHEVKLDENQILVIVGPNNAGKSASIREIYNYIINNTMIPLKIIRQINLLKKGSDIDLVNYITNNTHIDPINQYPAYHYFSEISNQNPNQISKVHLDLKQIIPRWNENNLRGYEFGVLFVNYLTISKRLLASKPIEPFNISKENPAHPFHYLIEYESLYEKFSKLFKTAFNQDILINRGVATKIPLYIGKAPVMNVDEDRVTLSYIRRLIELPTLEEQGDGMRGFVGVLLSILASSQSLLMIDEPEAFLHPPQAKLLGKYIGKEIPNDKQIIIATHSEDILKGLIDVASKRLKIIRLKRESEVNRYNRQIGLQEINHVSELNNASIKKLWDDPILRYSNILSGLFHSRVILCEGDADCRFYSAMNDIIVDESKDTLNEVVSSDLLFVHCGGKGKMYIVVKALKELDVPISVAVDIDVLRETSALKKIIDALRGSWECIKDDYVIFSNSINDNSMELNKEILRKQILTLLDGVEGDTLDKSQTDSISRMIKKTTIWDRLKKNGKSALPAGDVFNAFERMISYLRSIDLHVVEIGELECFVRNVPNKGPEWVNEVLERMNLAEPLDLTTAKQFVKQLVTKV